MASLHNYVWWNAGPTNTDTLASVGSQYLATSGYATMSDLIDAIRAQNPLIGDWQNVPTGTVVTLPFQDVASS